MNVRYAIQHWLQKHVRSRSQNVEHDLLVREVGGLIALVIVDSGS